MKKETREALEHISTHTVQRGHMLERMSAQIEAQEARLAKLIIDHEERMEKAVQAILFTSIGRGLGNQGRPCITTWENANLDITKEE